MTTYFSNLRKLFIDRETGFYVASNNPLEPIEGFYSFTQTIPASTWTLQHQFDNLNYIIQVFILQPDGTYKNSYPNIIQSSSSVITLDFDGALVSGYACILFPENDITIIVTPTPSITASVTASYTPTPTPTITPTKTNTPTPAITHSPTAAVTVTPTNTTTVTLNPTPSVTKTQTPTPTSTDTPTPTPSTTHIAITVTPTPTITSTITPTPSGSGSNFTATAFDPTKTNSAATLSNFNLTITSDSSTGNWETAVGVNSYNYGKPEVEFTHTNSSFGDYGSLAGAYADTGTSTKIWQATSSVPGSTPESSYGSGLVYSSAGSTNYEGATFGTSLLAWNIGDILTLSCDFTVSPPTYKFQVNGVLQYTGVFTNSATNTLPYAPCGTGRLGSGITMNSGQTPLIYSLPGYAGKW